MREIGSWFGRHEDDAASPDVFVVGCPFDGAVTGRRGAAEGPTQIRRWCESAEAIDEHGRSLAPLTARDLGDVACDDDARARIEARATEAGGRWPGALQLGLGGDHSVTPPLFAAVRRRHPDVRLLLLDAHPDCFDSYDGDPWSHACAVARCLDPGGLAPEHVGLVGLRSYASPERALIDRLGLVISSAEWLEGGATAVSEAIATSLAGGPLYVSLDIDVLDPAAAPGTGYPVAGGPMSRQLLDLLAALWQRADVVALDLVEVAPALDPSDITAATASHLLLQVLAHEAHRRAGAPG